MSHLVFVYGTLKRGQPNHGFMTKAENGKATFIGEARTVDKWPLVVATKFNIPFMLDKPGLGHVSISLAQNVIVFFFFIPVGS